MGEGSMPTSASTQNGVLYFSPDWVETIFTMSPSWTQGEHTNCLPHCSTASLAFYWEQMKLAKQSWNLISRLYREAKVDGDQKLNSFHTSVTDVLDGWGTGNDSLSFGPCPDGAPLNLE